VLSLSSTSRDKFDRVIFLDLNAYSFPLDEKAEEIAEHCRVDIDPDI